MFENKEDFKREFTLRLIEKYGRDPKDCDLSECYDILGTMVRDYANIDNKECKDLIKKHGNKQLIYFSMEFLIGRLLTNNMINLGIFNVVKDGLDDLGLDLQEIEDQESDAGLGNGGLGRLAACFMDSIASLGYAGHGNTIRYDYGFFRQKLKNGHQEELPDQWLINGNVWEIRKPKHAVTVKLYGNAETYQDEKGNLKRRTVNALNILAIPCDVSIVGYNNKVTNTLRLWTAEPSSEDIPEGASFTEYLNYVRDITHGLYPDDTTENGKLLRLRQQYFLVSAGLQSTLRMHYRHYHTFDNLAEHIVFQLNDTHPILAIPELMRLLMDEHDYGWDEAYEICTKCFAFTNHTVMAEALEKWPCQYIANLCPRVYMIIEEIDRRKLIEMREKGYSEQVIDNARIIKDGMVRMCQLAIHVSFSVNGVAHLHTEILKHDTFKELYQIYPEKFNNKTNGITHRRWFLAANPKLSSLVTSLIGAGWITNPSELEKLLKYKDDVKVLDEINKIKVYNKDRLIKLIKRDNGIDVDRNSIFDVQIKRLHAYKRQLMNIFRIIYLYLEMKKDKNFRIKPHTYIFGAKAAPSYVYAKKIIELILAVADKINSDPEISKYMKVVFIENYGVSKAEAIIPAADVSEQISLAGKEASGTSNMKFMINGALTLGTLDGANVEISQLVGDENAVIFGMHEDEVSKIRYEGSYNPWDVYNKDPRVKEVMDSLINGEFSEDNNQFRMIFDEIMYRNDEYFILKDFDSYLKASEKIDNLYEDRRDWAKKCLINIAKSGYFSSDRTIEQYNEDIWHLQKIR